MRGARSTKTNAMIQPTSGKIYIDGRVTQRKYTDKNGLERTSVDVQATDMEMLTPKSASSGSESYSAVGAGDSNDPFLPDYPDDIS